VILAPDSAELADVAAGWRSAYVHIPFCRRRCPYCDFAVVAPGDRNIVGIDDLMPRYIEALHREIDMEEPWQRLDAINFGGGTPSAVGSAAIADLIAHLRDRFGVADGAEMSLEANPEDVTGAVVDAWVAAGVNRVSIGVQSFDDTVLASLGRAHVSDQGAAAVAVTGSRMAVGIDLIFGTPGESLQSWSETVAAALRLGPDHVSAYALTVETGTGLWRDVRAGGPAPDPDDQADKYELMQQAAAESGLVQYEVSNYATAGNGCRYNLATWGQGEYLGFGLGAHGHRDSCRRRNVRSIGAYLRSVAAGERPEAGRDIIAGSAAELERLILGIRRTCGVEMGDSSDRIAASPAIARLVDAGVVAIRGGRMIVLQPLLADDVAVTVLSLSPADC